MSSIERFVEIAFIHDGERVQAQFMANPEQMALLADLEQALAPEGIPQLGSLVLDMAVTGNATELVDTIRTALSLGDITQEQVGLEPMDRAWARAADLARQIDALAKDQPTQPLILEFIWDNGGGDDNIFSQGFLSAVGPQGDELADLFFDAITEAGQNDYYDVGLSPPGTHMDLAELVAFLDERDAEIPGAERMRVGIEEIMAASTPQAPVLRARP